VIIGGLGSIWGAMWGTAAIVVLPEILKRVNEDVTNLVFGVLLIAIMVLWQGRTQSLWQNLKALLPRRGLAGGTGPSGDAEGGGG
jgi:ABC-type branched-subunit amino acid transport system permease subunit